MPSLENKSEVFGFIEKNQKEDIKKVALILGKKKDLPRDYILNQINGIQKSKNKFPFLTKYPKFIYGSLKNVSQSSSQLTAEYKSKLFSGRKAVDLSGGMGMDTIFLSKSFKEFEYVEKDEETFNISSKNFNILNLKNVKTSHSDAASFLKNTNDEYDLIYLDPDRKVDNKKVFLLEDCEPNVIELFPILKKRTKNCLFKFSPLIDINSLFKAFENQIDIHIVSVKNDCKEILVIAPGSGTVNCLNNTGIEWEDFNLVLENEKDCEVNYSDPLKYLYEPNSSIMKAGAFKSVAKKYELFKISANTHLYTSNSLIKDFPGKRITIHSCEPPKAVNEKWNLINRNFGKSIDWIKKKYKVKEGGNNYLFAFRNKDNKPLFVKGSKI